MKYFEQKNGPLQHYIFLVTNSYFGSLMKDAGASWTNDIEVIAYKFDKTIIL